MAQVSARIRSTKAAHDSLFNLFISKVGAMSPLDALGCLLQSNDGFARLHPIRNSADRTRARNTFNHLLAQEYIVFDHRAGSVVLQLTDKGKKKAQAKVLIDSLDARSTPKPNTWDGKWRLILFDIPAHERSKRNAFRMLIRKLGAVMLQKSVWAYPYDCAHELSQLADLFELTDYHLRLVIAEDVAGDSALLKHYKLKQFKK